MRNPLKSGTIVKMPNQGQYVIGEKIGEGGLSLIYAAKTKTNGYPVIIKEFFPLNHARRAENTVKDVDGTVIARRGQVCSENGHEEHFMRCRKAFDQEGQLGSLARRNTFQIISFSDCGNGYAVLPRWSEDSCSFLNLVDEWRHSPPQSADPFFTDLGRIRFALTAINSLLSVVSSVHKQGMLHLDISPGNVVWSGNDQGIPESGVAFLTDFGCSVMVTDGFYPADRVLSYSREYAAPEYTMKDGRLTQATDVFSVGRLLCFLCLGWRMFDEHSSLESLINKLHISSRHRESLLAIIRIATDVEMDRRYQTAADMQKDVGELLRAIPLYPINEDNRDAFTLYSLKSMLEGSLDTHYSWAHELMDRRKITIDIPESVYKPVASISNGRYASEEDFFNCVMPRVILRFFKQKFESNQAVTLKNILLCNYPKEWKEELAQKILAHGPKDLIGICNTLLHNHTAFHSSRELLFKFEGVKLKKYYNRCNMEGAPYIGLALITLYALLGEDCFETMFQKDVSQCASFWR